MSDDKRKDVYPIGKKIPICRFIRRCGRVTSSSSPARSRRTPTATCYRARSSRRPRALSKSIRRILAEEGVTLTDVVRVTTYLEDARDFGRYNKVFAEYFKDAVLARTTVEARAVINTKIEMDAIAYKPK